MRSPDEEPTGAVADDVVGGAGAPPARGQAYDLAAIFGQDAAPVIEVGAALDGSRDRLAALFAGDSLQPRPSANSADPPETLAAESPSYTYAQPPAPVRRRWSPRVRWSVAASVVLVAAVVGASVFVGQMLVAGAQHADAVAALDAAEAAIEAPRARLSAAVVAYDSAVADAQTAADSAAPALAAVAGMSDQAALEAALEAQSDLAAALALLERPVMPAVFESPELGESASAAAIDAAAAGAREHVHALGSAASEVDTAAAEINARLAVLMAAQVELAGSLPATAELIGKENPLAEKEFRDAVTAAAAAVGDAQMAVGSGDAELLAYALAVEALRADQARAVEEAARSPRTSRPVTPTPQPTTPAAPAPEPDPDPAPEPDPESPAEP